MPVHKLYSVGDGIEMRSCEECGFTWVAEHTLHGGKYNGYTCPVCTIKEAAKLHRSDQRCDREVYVSLARRKKRLKVLNMREGRVASLVARNFSPIWE